MTCPPLLFDGSGTCTARCRPEFLVLDDAFKLHFDIVVAAVNSVVPIAMP